MALLENLHDLTAEPESPEDIAPKQKQNLNSPFHSKAASENSSGCCECNICLDTAREPVVTLCGHLYCWPCIYKWLHVHNSSIESDNNQPKCPVCKASISNSSLVPLYGRGNSSEPESKKPQVDLVIPSRPSALGGSTVPPNPIQQIHTNIFEQQSLPHPFEATSRALTSSGFSPTVGVLGEMFFAMMYRNSDEGLYDYYPYQQSSYTAMVMGDGSRRIRRQVMQVETSLNRLTIFFFCCFFLCLLLF